MKVIQTKNKKKCLRHKNEPIFRDVSRCCNETKSHKGLKDIEQQLCKNYLQFKTPVGLKMPQLVPIRPPTPRIIILLWFEFIPLSELGL